MGLNVYILMIACINKSGEEGKTLERREKKIRNKIELIL